MAAGQPACSPRKGGTITANVLLVSVSDWAVESSWKLDRQVAVPSLG